MAGRLSQLLRRLQAQPTPPPETLPKSQKENRYLRALRLEIELQQRRKAKK